MPQNGAAAEKVVHSSSEENAGRKCILTAADVTLDAN